MSMMDDEKKTPGPLSPEYPNLPAAPPTEKKKLPPAGFVPDGTPIPRGAA